MKSKKPSLYDAQEEQIQLQSASFVDFLTRKGVLEDHNIDNERVRKAKKDTAQRAYHNTEVLLSQYRLIIWVLECIPGELSDELEVPVHDIDALAEKIDIQTSLENARIESRVNAMMKTRYLVDRIHEALQGTQITGGHISTTAVSADGKSASVDMFNASQFEKPEVPHSVVTAADGSQWYQMASGEGRGAFYDVPTFHGVGADIPNTAAGDGVSGASQPGESGQSFGETLTHDGVEGHPGMVTYPGAADGIGAADTPAPESTLLTGVAASPVGGGDQPPIGYGNGAPSVDTVYGNAPEAQHFGAAYAGGFGESPQNGAQFADHGENVGQGFYSEAPLVAATFPSAPEGTSLRTVGDGVIEASSPDGGNTLWYNSAYYQEPDAPHSVMQSSNGVDWYAMQQQGNIPQFEVGEAAAAYNQAAFQNFMPGYDLPVSQVDGTHRQDGYFEVRHEDGSGTKFYDIARYAAPRGDYQVFEDSRGSQWYAIQGDAAVDRKPVYENGKPVYDNGKLRTTNVETIRYKQTPTRFAEPEKRGDIERKPPKRKM